MIIIDKTKGILFSLTVCVTSSISLLQFWPSALSVFLKTQTIVVITKVRTFYITSVSIWWLFFTGLSYQYFNTFNRKVICFNWTNGLDNIFRNVTLTWNYFNIIIQLYKYAFKVLDDYWFVFNLNKLHL